ncbi:MAG: hypothetical protein ACXAC5_02260 [Promethearchaeota archaeon]|jgi:hypothetical protein
MNKQALINAAVQALDHYISDSMDFVDAECRVAREFNLTEAEVSAMRETFDKMNT